MACPTVHLSVPLLTVGADRVATVGSWASAEADVAQVCPSAASDRQRSVERCQVEVLLDDPVPVVADVVERVAHGTEVQHASFGFDEHVELDGLGERDALALDSFADAGVDALQVEIADAVVMAA